MLHNERAIAAPGLMLEELQARLAADRERQQRLHDRLEAQRRLVAAVLARDAEMRDNLRDMREAMHELTSRSESTP